MSPGPRELYVPPGKTIEGVTKHNISWDNQLERAIKLVSTGEEPEVIVHRHGWGKWCVDPDGADKLCVAVLHEEGQAAKVVLVSERAASQTGSVD